jgi:hypothetical protein
VAITRKKNMRFNYLSKFPRATDMGQSHCLGNLIKLQPASSVVDTDQFDSDPDPTFYFDGRRILLYEVQKISFTRILPVPYMCW